MVKTSLIYEDRYDERLKKLKLRNLHDSDTLGCVNPDGFDLEIVVYYYSIKRDLKTKSIY